MKALLLTPTYFPQLTGNAVTVDRISKHLSQAGITFSVLNLSQLKKEQVIREALLFQPDIIHAFHAYKSGRIAQWVKKRAGSHLITTMTGTDLNIDLKSAKKKKLVLEVLENSDAITVFNEAAHAVLLEAGIPKEKITIIHQSVSFPKTPYKDFRQLLNISQDKVVFLMVGAIRRIKNMELAFAVLKELKHRFPGIHLIIAGPVIEDDAFRKLQLHIAGENWVNYMGEVPRENIRSLFLSADVFLNTSFSESESNAMLEALSCRMIVVGKDIPGNSSLLTNDTGFLFSNKKDLYRKMIYIMNNLKSLSSMRQNAAARAAIDFQYAKEQDGYLELYKIISKIA